MAMVYPMQSDEIERRQKLLSSHIEPWSGQKVTGDGWSQLSMDSSEMGDIASPFDDIGFLAGGPGPAMDPVPPKRATDKTKKISDLPSITPKPSLGKFLDTKRPDEQVSLEEATRMSNLSQRGDRRRLDKTLSTRHQFQDEEASLALSVALAGGDKTKTTTTRNLFDFSKQSLGLSVLGSSKGKGKAAEYSKNSFDASKSATTKSTMKSHESSKSSFGFGTSRSSAEGSRKLGSKFSSMMRSKNESNKLSKSEERVCTLEAENLELTREVKKLQAKMEEMANLVAMQTMLKDWRTTEELAASTTELWQYKSLAILADLQLDRMEAKIVAQDRLIEAKERSICNLESVRSKQEMRIGYLEMQCLQNGIEIAEDGDMAPAKLIEEEVPLKSDDDDDDLCDDDHESSFASFQDDGFCHTHDAPFNIHYTPQRADPMTRSNRSDDSRKEKDLGRSTRSESSSSMCLSDLSGHSLAEEDGGKPMSLQHIGKKKAKAVPLEKFLSNDVPKQHCFETGTWDPTKALDFANNSPRDVGVIPPPPPPLPTADHIRSAPSPSNRKSVDGTVVSRSSRSKSPGTRRRLKGTKVDSDTDSQARMVRRSNSPRARRKLKDPASGTTCSNLDGSMTDLGKNSRRKLRSHKSDMGPSSTHSLGRGSAHRRRQRKESEFDRQTVSTALEKALGASLNVLDMDDDLLDMKVLSGIESSFKARKHQEGSMMVRSKASLDEHDEGLDLDDVFRD